MKIYYDLEKKYERLNFYTDEILKHAEQRALVGATDFMFVAEKIGMREAPQYLKKMIHKKSENTLTVENIELLKEDPDSVIMDIRIEERPRGKVNMEGGEQKKHSSFSIENLHISKS